MLTYATNCFPVRVRRTSLHVINKINGPTIKGHNRLTSYYLYLCVFVSAAAWCCPHLWMFITSLKRDREKGEIKMERVRKELTRMIGLCSPSVPCPLATTGTMFD